MAYSVFAHATFVISVSLVLSLLVYVLRSQIHKLRTYESELVNFIGGFVYAYLFFSLIPEVFASKGVSWILSFFQILLAFCGYMIFYLAEKRIFEKKRKGRPIAKKLLRLRTDGFFVLHFLMGFVILYSVQTQNLFAALITIVPIALHLLLTTFLYEDLHNWMKESARSAVYLPLLIIVGTIVAAITTFVIETPLLFFFSFFAGTFLYLTTTLLRPQHHHKNLALFVLGAIIYIFLFVLSIVYF